VDYAERAAGPRLDRGYNEAAGVGLA
jgi:hypothetical protein